MTRFLLIDHKQ